MAKAIKVDWSTSDSEEETTPIANVKQERKDPPSRKARLNTPTVKKFESSNRQNDSEAGGSQRRQKKANSQNTDAITENIDAFIRMKNNNTILSHQYLNKWAASNKNNKCYSRLELLISEIRKRELDEENRRRERLRQILQETTPNIAREPTIKKQPIRKKKQRKNSDKKRALKQKNIKEMTKTLRQLYEKVHKMNKLKNESSLNKIFCVHSENIEDDIAEEKPSPISEQPMNLTNDNTLKTQAEESAEESARSDESINRTGDNVLITNKYLSVDPPSNNEVLQNTLKDEWIPIGGGATLIHKDKYRKVNWKSYTIATRTLLLAAFSRSVLATHSLTGKRSPAFQDKPAKMCLDQRIVCDILNEITSRFKVKANHVRSIITTKCADEAKMLRMRLAKKKTSRESRQLSNDQENDPIINTQE